MVVETDPLLGAFRMEGMPACWNHASGVVFGRTTMSVYETRVQDGCEVTTTDDKYAGPFPEYDKYGGLTGCSYVRCSSCGIEVLTGRKEFATHRDGCEYEGTDE